jgi:hypothetical protein
VIGVILTTTQVPRSRLGADPGPAGSQRGGSDIDLAEWHFGGMPGPSGLSGEFRGARYGRSRAALTCGCEDNTIRP